MRDDGRLLVAMARRRQVEQPPHRGVAAVGGEQHAAAHAAAFAELDGDLARVASRRTRISAPTTSCACGAELQARRRARCAAACLRRCVLDRARRCRRCRNRARRRRNASGAFPHAHASIRRRARLRDALPDADLLEELLRRARQRVHARVHLVAAPAWQRPRVEHEHAQAIGAAAGREQRGRREPDDAGAGNEDGGCTLPSTSQSSRRPRASRGKRPDLPIVWRASNAFAPGSKSNAMSPRPRPRPKPGAASPKSWIRPCVNDETRCRSPARHAAYRSSSSGAPTSAGRSRGSGGAQQRRR